MLRNFFAREELSGRYTEGQGLVEYALILVLISVVAILAMRPLGTAVAQIFTDITTAL